MKVKKRFAKTEYVEVEKDIEIPSYFRLWDDVYFAVVSEKDIVKITTYDHSNKIEVEPIDHMVSQMNEQTFREVDEAEFKTGFEKAVKIIYEKSGLKLTLETKMITKEI